MYQNVSIDIVKRHYKEFHAAFKSPNEVISGETNAQSFTTEESENWTETKESERETFFLKQKSKDLRSIEVHPKTLPKPISV